MGFGVWGSFGVVLLFYKYIIFLHIYIYIPTHSKLRIYIYTPTHSKLRIKRHDSLCEILFHALSTDNSNYRRKQRYSSVNMSRPGDMFHPDFDQGLPMYFDISVQNSLQPSYIMQGAAHSGIAAEAGELKKDIRHNSLVSASGSVSIPLLWSLWVCGQLIVSRS